MSRLPFFAALLAGCAPAVDQIAWEVGEQRIEADACGVWDGDAEIAEAGMLDFHASPTGLALDLGLDDSVHCAESAEGIRCAPIAMEQSVNGSIITTSITLDADRTGAYDLDGQYLLEMDCQGPLCKAWSMAIDVDFPCESAVGFSALGY